MPYRLLGTTVEVLASSTGVTILAPGTGEVLAAHPLMAPGQAGVLDAHYGRPRPNNPAVGVFLPPDRQRLLNVIPIKPTETPSIH